VTTASEATEGGQGFGGPPSQQEAVHAQWNEMKAPRLEGERIADLLSVRFCDQSH